MPAQVQAWYPSLAPVQVQAWQQFRLGISACPRSGPARRPRTQLVQECPLRCLQGRIAFLPTRGPRATAPEPRPRACLFGRTVPAARCLSNSAAHLGSKSTVTRLRDLKRGDSRPQLSTNVCSTIAGRPARLSNFQPDVVRPARLPNTCPADVPVQLLPANSCVRSHEATHRVCMAPRSPLSPHPIPCCNGHHRGHRARTRARCLRCQRASRGVPCPHVPRRIGEPPHLPATCESSRQRRNAPSPLRGSTSAIARTRIPRSGAVGECSGSLGIAQRRRRGPCRARPTINRSLSAVS